MAEVGLEAIASSVTDKFGSNTLTCHMYPTARAFSLSGIGTLCTDAKVPLIGGEGKPVFNRVTGMEDSFSE